MAVDTQSHLASPSVLLLPVAREGSAANYQRSVENGINVDRLDEWVGTDLADELREQWGTGIAAWGCRDNTREGMGSGAQPMYWDRIHSGETIFRARILRLAAPDAG